MHLSKLLMVLILGFAFVTVTYAHEAGECTTTPKQKWMHMDDVKVQLSDLGYQIRKVKISGSCYEVYGKDPKGIKGEFFVDPVTLKLIETIK